MKVARWGNSLAVRLPRELTEELSLREGDEIALRSLGGKLFEVVPDRSREEAMRRIRETNWPAPPGYRFNRDEIYDRPSSDAPGRVGPDDER